MSHPVVAVGADDPKRFWRYLAPNSITALSLILGLGSIWGASHGRYDLAAWLVVLASLTDRLDGFVARLVRGTSELGVQLDSFADFLNFGIAPAWLSFAFIEANQRAFGYSDAYLWFCAACSLLWVIGAVFRLARYNIHSDEAVPTKIFFGVPTTLAGGLFAIWFLAFYKYAQPGAATFGGAKLLPETWTVSAAQWRYLPIAMLVGAFLMVSSLRMLKAGKTNSRWKTWTVGLVMAYGALFGMLQLYPETLVIAPSLWILVFLIWGQVVPEVKNLRPPPLFPRATEAGQPHMRHQEDLADEEQD
ncbi:MAG: CDP-alcohol phosphatidyltransferase family protein [Myxococcales bacterium]|nr:CDP-alcohol phosphatidyltransferase family protein [Myxococcales bacterium]